MDLEGVVVPLAVLVRLMEFVGERERDRELVWEVEMVAEEVALGDVSLHTTFRTLLLSGSGMYRVTRPLGASDTAPTSAIWLTAVLRVPKQALVPTPSTLVRVLLHPASVITLLVVPSPSTRRRLPPLTEEGLKLSSTYKNPSVVMARAVGL